MWKLTKAARGLRRNQTDAEQRLWFALRDRRLDGAKFRRQVPVDGYIVDFLCKEAKLVVELDGGQHADQTSEDAARTARLEILGYRVIRFWNNDIHGDLPGVLEIIRANLSSPAC